MFNRRVEKGQHYQAPYFGCREFPAEVLPATPELVPIADTRDLGIMLWDIEFGEHNVPVFFSAKMVRGVIEVPRDAAAARKTLTDQPERSE